VSVGRRSGQQPPGPRRGRYRGWLAAASAGAFVAAFYLRMNAAYGPLHLSWHPADWLVLWELWRYGQMATGVVVQAAALGVAAALVPWVALRLAARRHR
jgi:hypothetical protein